MGYVTYGKTHFTVSLCLLLTILMLLFTGVGAQENDPQDDFVPSPELIEQLERIEQSTSAIRGLMVINPVDRHFPTRDEVRAYVNESLEGEDSDQIFEAARHFYAAFGFIAGEMDLRQIYSELLSSQIAGYYDTETKEMNTVLMSGNRPSTTLPALEAITYSHEYTHALQDQYYNLDDFISETINLENPDEAQARLSLVEGDASYVMNQYTLELAEESPLTLLMQAAILSMSGSTAMPAGTPDILIDELMSPYVDGLGFVQALVETGGYELVDEAFENPPVSTEQILHPERYLAGDMPVDVTLADDSFDEATGWQVIFDRRLGEFYLSAYLDQYLGALDASIAAAGWGGDRYRIYYNPQTDENAFILKIVWDTPEEANGFASAMAEYGELGYESAADPDGCWTGEVVVCFARTEDATLVSSAPDKDFALELLARQLELQPA
jgi:hypothetical protein